MMAAADRRDMRAIIAETRNALDLFEERLNEFSTVLDELEAEARRQTEQKGWL
jgi:hypothetical protein